MSPVFSKSRLINQQGLLLFFLLCSLSTFGQRMISGVVVLEDNQEPLPGIRIFQKGVAGGVISDLNGRFSIVLKDSTTTLVFAFVGMATNEVDIEGQSEVLVEMKEDCIKCFFDAQVLGF